MAGEIVRVTYVLNDKISRQLKLIQKSSGYAEAKLQNLDRQVHKIATSKDPAKFATNVTRSLDRVNKSMNNVTQSYKTMEVASKNSYNAQQKLGTVFQNNTSKLNAQTGAVNNYSKALNNGTTTTSRASGVAEKYGKVLDQTAKAEKNFVKHSDVKTRSVERQGRGFQGAHGHASRYNGMLGSLIGNESKYRSVLREVADYSFFRDGFTSGAKMFEVSTKILGILPLIGVAAGGAASAINGLAAGAVAAAGSLGRLGSVAAALPGLMAAAAVGMGGLKAIMKSVVEPSLKNVPKLEDAQERVTEAQSRISDAQGKVLDAQDKINKASRDLIKAENAATDQGTTVSEFNRLAEAQAKVTDSKRDAADVQKNIGELQREANKAQEEYNKLQNQTPKKAKALYDEVEKTKISWMNLWQSAGTGKDIIDIMIEGMKLAQRLMVTLGPQADRLVDLFVRMADAVFSFADSPAFRNFARNELNQAIDNLGKMFDIAFKLLPLAMSLFAVSQRWTAVLLDIVDGWADTLSTSEKVEEVTQSVTRWLVRGYNSLQNWGAITRNLAKTFANIFAAASGTTTSFEESLVGTTAAWSEWTGRADNMQKMSTFFRSSFEILKGLGRLAADIGLAFGIIAGTGGSGSGTASAAKTVASVNGFLEQLGNGIIRFAGFAKQALDDVGPSLSALYTAMGRVTAGTGDGLIKIINAIVNGAAYMINAFAELTETVPGAKAFLSALIALRLGLLAVGFATGSILGPLARAAKLIAIAFGAKGGLKTSMAQGGALSGPVQNVFVTNWPPGMGGMGPTGPGGRGPKGGPRKGWGSGGAGGSFRGRIGAAYGGARNYQGMGRIAAAGQAGKSALRAAGMGGGLRAAGAGLGRGTMRAIPIAGYGLMAYDAVKIMSADDMTKGQKSIAGGTLAAGGLGATGGAMLGAGVGTMIMPGVGTAIGGVVGGTAGYVAGTKAGQYTGGKLADAASWISGGETSGDIKRMEEAGQKAEEQGNAYRAISQGKRQIQQTTEGFVSSQLATVNLLKDANSSAAEQVGLAAGLNNADTKHLIEVQRNLQVAKATKEADKLLGQTKLDTAKQQAAARKKLTALGMGTKAANEVISGVKGNRVKRTNAAIHKKLGYEKIGGTEVRIATAKTGKGSTADLKQQEMMRHKRSGGEYKAAQVVTQAQAGGMRETANAVAASKDFGIKRDAALKNLDEMKKQVDEKNQGVIDTLNKNPEVINDITTQLQTSLLAQGDAMVKTIDANGRNITKANRGWVTDNAELFQALDPSIDIGALTGAASTAGKNKAPVKRARGGWIPGNPATGDSVKAMLTPGEVVLNKEQQARIGHNTVRSAVTGGAIDGRAPNQNKSDFQKFSGGGYVWPLPDSYRAVGSTMADHMKRAFGNWQSDRALDIAAPDGTTAYAVADGAISKVSIDSSYNPASNPNGSSVTLSGADNAWWYGHLIDVAVKAGQRVAAGTPIGRTGTANSVSHLHIGQQFGDPSATLMGGSTGSGTASATNNAIAKLANMTAAPNFGTSVMGRATQSGASRLRSAINAQVAARNNGGGILGALSGTVPGGPKGIAKAMLGQFGWGEDQWPALEQLWQNESGWNPTIANSSSGAYGIPQALPGSKMANEGQGGGPDWRTNPETQIRWGMNYIKNRPDYGSPSKALAMWNSRSPHWYGNGGSFRTKKPHLIGVGEKGPEDVTITPARGRKGGGGGGRGHTINSNIHVGTLIADDAGIELLAQKVGGVMVNDLRRARGATTRDEG